MSKGFKSPNTKGRQANFNGLKERHRSSARKFDG